VRRRLGRWAVAVGALAVIVAWITRQRKAANVIKKSYERTREQLSARGQERGQEETGEESTRGPEEAEGPAEREGDATEGHKEYYRRVIKESMERSGLS
jgi:hypothetical protein